MSVGLTGLEYWNFGMDVHSPESGAKTPHSVWSTDVGHHFITFLPQILMQLLGIIAFYKHIPLFSHHYFNSQQNTLFPRIASFECFHLKMAHGFRVNLAVFQAGVDVKEAGCDWCGCWPGEY